MPYRVKVDAFEGPFDLLLHLISKRELDIYEISLAAITEEYLSYLKTMQDLDLEIATEFLVVAATLIEIKASRLLPGPPADEEEALAISERDLLIARLLEYRAFKEAATALAGAMAHNAGYVGRTAGAGPEFAKLAPDLLARVTAEDLAALAAAALAPKPLPRVDVSHIAPIRASVADAIAAVRAALRRTPTASFRELTRACGARIEVIVRFLAVLELVKRAEVDVAQAETFGDIEVRAIEGAGRTDDIVIDEYEGVADARRDEP